MGSYLLKVLDWSEVWAPLIPLMVLAFRRNQPASLKPVIIYLVLGFILNLFIDIIMVINIYTTNFSLSNNPIYNIHSVVRFTCFSIYFLKSPQTTFSRIKKSLPVVALIFLFVNFVFFENFFNFNSLSGNLMAMEAYLLLIYCMLYYLSELKDDSKNLFTSPDFWVVTGLAIYVVVNFFVFLFYIPMISVDVDLAINIWNVHNIAFIIFCLFLTRAFYGSFRYKFTV